MCGGGLRRYFVLLRKNIVQIFRSPGFFIAELILFLIFVAGAAALVHYAGEILKKGAGTVEYSNRKDKWVYAKMSTTENVLVALGKEVNITEFNIWKKEFEEAGHILTVESSRERLIQRLVNQDTNNVRIPVNPQIVRTVGIDTTIPGLYITKMDHKKGILSYEMFVDKKNMKDDQGSSVYKLDRGWQQDTPEGWRNYGLDEEYDKFQFSVDFNFYENAKKYGPKNATYALASSDSMLLKKKDILGHKIFLLKHVIFIVMIIFSIRSILHDKLNMMEFMSVMGVSEVSFYASHATLLLLKQIVFITPLVLLLSNLTFLGMEFVIIPTIIEFFVVIAFCILITSIWTSYAVATFLTIIFYCALAFSSIFTISYPFDGHATILYMLSPWAAHQTYLDIVGEVTRMEGRYSFAYMFQWKNFMYPAALPLAFMVFDMILMILASLFMQKAKSISCIRKGKNKNEDLIQVYSHAEEEIELKGAVVDIEIENVTKIYGTGQKAVNGLNLTALRGQVTVLLGHNGAGKTTTFSMICGTEKPTEGKVNICGAPAGTSKAKMNVGYCSQKNTLIPNMTVMDHLRLAYGLKCAKSKFSTEADELLKLVGLEALKSKKTKKLSGGQKRKLCLCMALIGDSKVVLLDEPTAGMDVESRQDVETFLDAQKGKRTILLTTHYMDEAESLGDRVFIISGGRVVCSGSTDFLKKRFASGYTLTVLAKGKEKEMGQLSKVVEDRIRGHIEKVQVGDTRGMQMEFTIPVEARDNMAKLFSDLEQNKESLNVADFGLSMSNLEQVFLKVGHTVNEKKSEEKDEKHLRELLKKVYDDDHVKGFCLFMRQFGTLFKKKFIYSLNHWFITFFFQMALPIICLISFALITNESLFKEPQWEVGMKDFGSVEVVFKGQLPNNTVHKSIVNYLKGEQKNNKELSMKELKNEDLQRYLIKKTDDPLPGIAFDYTYELRGDMSQCATTPSPLSNAPVIHEIYHRHGCYNPWDRIEAVKIMYTRRHLYSLPTAINILSNANIRIVNPGGRISTQIFYYETPQSHEKLVSTGYTDVVVLLIVLIFAFLAEPLGEDICSGFMYQQILAGLPVGLYWTVEYLYAFLLFAYQAAFYLSALHFIGFSMINIVRALALCGALYFSAMPLVASFCVVCKTASAATVSMGIFMAAGHLLAKLLKIPLMILVYVIMFYFKTMNQNDVENFLFVFEAILCAICPSFAFYSGVDRISNLQKYQNSKTAVDSTKKERDETQFVVILSIMVFSVLLNNTIFFITRCGCCKRARCCCNGKKKFLEKTERIKSIGNDSHKSVRQSVLKVENLGKVFSKKLGPALAHVSFEVRERECFGLLGVTGAGKTTAFNIITAQERADAGTVEIDGKNVKGGLVIGLCPQFDTLEPTFKGRQALKILASIHGYRHTSEVVNNLIKMVDMQDHAKKKFTNCSGGQKRRLSVAAALLPRKSPFVILDEATAGIDPVARRDVWSVLSVVREHSAILMSSHSMEECEALCSRIAILRKGQIAATGTSQQLKSNLGNFYVLSLALNSVQEKDKAIEAVGKAFPGAVVQKGSFSRNVKWKVPRTKTDLWSAMFAKCEAVANELSASDFCLTQPSLQDIFLIIANNTVTEAEAAATAPAPVVQLSLEPNLNAPAPNAEDLGADPTQLDPLDSDPSVSKTQSPTVSKKMDASAKKEEENSVSNHDE